MLTEALSSGESLPPELVAALGVVAAAVILVCTGVILMCMHRRMRRFRSIVNGLATEVKDVRLIKGASSGSARGGGGGLDVCRKEVEISRKL